MNLLRVLVVALALTITASTAAMAARAVPGTNQTPPVKAPPPQAPPKPTPPPEPKDPKVPTYEETVVVSASKTEQKIVDAPATMSVFTPKMLEVNPAANYGDLLRTVPGVNVTQFSARDINITSRAATGSLATGQLAVIDGRSLYQDFFGFIMWDFMPTNMNEIKQIEVIRGPASAVWGANALSGVVNVITKSPREMRGAHVTFGAGTFDRVVNDNGAKAGGMYFVNGTFADSINSEWSYKLSGGMASTDAFARPLGLVPNGGTTPYPIFDNPSSKQPKGDVRLDRDFGDQHLSFSAGAAGTSGVMQTGVGPFRIDRGTWMGYGKVSYARKAFHAQAFINILDGNSPSLLSVDTAGVPVVFTFKTKTYDVELGDSRVAGRNVVTYGGNLRLATFNLTLAPGETSRKEGGAYVQDELFINDHLRLVAGIRGDKFSSIDKAVFSPRVALLIKPRSDQTFRLSYNRAFRAPSLINNNFDLTISNAFPLAALNPALGSMVFRVPTKATGNKNLTEEHVDAFEVSYTGQIGSKTLATAAVYYNKHANAIFFTVKENYSLTVPPPGWTSLPIWPAGPAGLPTAIGTWAFVQSRANFPKEFTYLNLGTSKDKGLELGLDSTLNDNASIYLNYSYQAQPIPEFPGLTATQALGEVNLPSKHRVNAGLSLSANRVFGNVNVSYADKAFWQDVLDARYSGTTKAYTAVNAVLGTRLGPDNRYSLQVKVNNIGNVAIQQHIFGDIIKRQVVAELRVNLPKK